MQTYNTTLAGVSFRPAEIKDLIRGLTTASVLTLLRDPENAYDANAVKVLLVDENDEEQFIGFLSAKDGTAGVVSQALADKRPCTVSVLSASNLDIDLAVEVGTEAEDEDEDMGDGEPTEAAESSD